MACWSFFEKPFSFILSLRWTMPSAYAFMFSPFGGGWVVGVRPQGPHALVSLLPRRRSAVKSRRRRCISLLTAVLRCGRPARRRRISWQGGRFYSLPVGHCLPFRTATGERTAASPAPILIKAAARVGRCALRSALLDRVGAGRAYQRGSACPAGAYVRRSVPSTGPSTARPAAA